ncbi:hypothetical protein, partial [Pseudomonas aeruginosa]
LGRIGIHTVTAAQGDAGQQHDEQGLQLHGKALFSGSITEAADYPPPPPIDPEPRARTAAIGRSAGAR